MAKLVTPSFHNWQICVMMRSILDKYNNLLSPPLAKEVSECTPA